MFNYCFYNINYNTSKYCDLMIWLLDVFIVYRIFKCLIDEYF